jgi:hypothetical protein
MFGNSFIFGFPNRKNLFLPFVSEGDKILLSLKKFERIIFKLFLYFFNALILTKIILYLIPDALIVHYLGANPCWNNFGTSAFTGSIIQIPGLLLHPLACTLAKQGITHAVIEIFIAAMIVVGIISLYFENKYSSQKTAIERDALSFNESRSIIRTHFRIKQEQKDEKNFVYAENDVFPEIFRISGDSQFCWLDIYGGNTYWPIFWGEKSEESKDE